MHGRMPPGRRGGVNASLTQEFNVRSAHSGSSWTPGGTDRALDRTLAYWLGVSGRAGLRSIDEL